MLWPRSTQLMVIVLLFAQLAGMSFYIPEEAEAQPPSVQGRAYNSTEHMSYTTTPPTIDGQISFGEWDNAAVYDISPGAAVVTLYIMFDTNRIYMAVDAVADVTKDTNDPGSGYITEFNTDYFLVTFDGDNDGIITYQNTDDGGGNEVMGQDAFTRGGLCVDRGATTSGGTNRKAGWWNRDSTGTTTSFWSIMASSPNQGLTEPYDYINTVFTTHRMYEHSIPYAGTGDELNLSRGDHVNISLSINDARSGNPVQIGAMPNGANGVSIFQNFMINSKPRAKISSLGGTVFYTGQLITFDASSSTEPDMEAMTYEWDFDYDGANFASDDSSLTVVHDYTVKGPHRAALRVTDPHGARDIKTVEFEVVEPPTAPVISGADPSAFNIVADEGASVVFKANYDDLNLDEPTEQLQVQWSVDSKLVSTDNKTMAGSTIYTFQSAYTGIGSAGKYIIKLRVNDTYNAKGKYSSGSMATTRTWNLTVNNINRAPLIDTYSPNALSLVLDEATTRQFSITRSDPDNDALTVKWYLGPNEITANAGLDTYTFNPNPPDYTLAGNYVLKVVVSDGSLSAEVSWSIMVDNINRAPIISNFNPRSDPVEVNEGDSKEFSFTANDPDLDNLTYTWYIGNDLVATGDGNDAFYLFKAGHIKKDGYDSSASPYDLRLELTDGLATVTKEWAIKVIDVNRPPVIVIASPADGGKYSIKDKVLLDATGTTDPDGGVLVYSWTTGDGKTFSDAKFTYQYPSPGEYTVTLKVLDGKSESTKTVKIELVVPIVKIDMIVHDPLSPEKDEAVRITATVRNTGNMDASDIVVTFYMDNTNNKIGSATIKSIPKGGTKDAQMTWTATSGKHRIIAQVEPSNSYNLDGTGRKELGLSVQGGATAQTYFGLSLPMFLMVILLVVIIIVMIVAVAASRRSRRRTDKAPEDRPEQVRAAHRPRPGPEPLRQQEPPAPVHYAAHHVSPEAMQGSDPGPAIAAAPPVVAAAAPVPEPEPEPAAPPMCRRCGIQPAEGTDGLCSICLMYDEPEPATVEEKTSEQPAPPLPVIAPVARPVPREDEGVEDFDLTEIFVVYEDGRLIDYATVKGDAEGDKDIISGMLVAIQNFVKTVMSAKNLDSFEMGNKKAIMERGRYLIVTCLLEGSVPPTLRDQMQDLVQKLEGLYAGVIEEWDGDKDSFKDLRRHLIPLFRLRAKSKIKEKEGVVQVKSAIEFYQGYVRLKVGIQNNLKTIITDAAFRLEWNKDTLRLSKTEPEYPMDGTTVIIGNIKPSEKKTVAYYLDPLICQESSLDGTLMYFDSFGKKHTADMKRRPADIVCPIFYTMETVNVAMLKRLLKDLNYSDNRIFEIESRPTLKAAYRLAKEVVRGHDIKEVREIQEEKPFESEAWFYGETKMSDEKIVIRVAARETSKYLELFVASKNLASLTGLLAELGHEFKKKVQDQGISSNVKQTMDEDIKEQIEQTMLLLDKYAESELGVSETDID